MHTAPRGMFQQQNKDSHSMPLPRTGMSNRAESNLQAMAAKTAGGSNSTKLMQVRVLCVRMHVSRCVRALVFMCVCIFVRSARMFA